MVGTAMVVAAVVGGFVVGSDAGGVEGAAAPEPKLCTCRALIEKPSHKLLPVGQFGRGPTVQVSVFFPGCSIDGSRSRRKLRQSFHSPLEHPFGSNS